MSDTSNLPLALWERGPKGEVVTITRATEADAATLVALYDEASAWLMARGLRQWPPGWWTEAVAVREMRAGHELYLAWRAGQPVGKLTLQWDDPETWGEQPPDAGYIHGLCVSRTAAELGLGAALLDWAGQRVRTRGRRWLRLDCMAANPRLRAYYERLGFVYRGIGDGGWAALYERPA
ncbi:MAG TPA: GNAT family N-acetyltransferase [Ktedonobacterales bacterium]|nr:GNAT family N-acetyltransferase [Ktedonobacterales bacterium]